MATFTGTADADDADAASGTLVGFTGGSIADLQDGTGDRFRGLEGADLIFAGSGDDAIFGGTGPDQLFGNGGADTFNYESDAEIGADTIDGGDGEDGIRIAFTGIADFRGATISSSTTTSIEVLVLEGAGHFVDFNADQVGGMEGGLASNLMIVGDDSGADIVTFHNASSLDLSAFQFDFWDTTTDVIEVRSDAGGSTVTGSSMRDFFPGGFGVDIISGGGGDDLFSGSQGDDTLRGEAGSDTFTYNFNTQIAGDTIDGGADAGGNRDAIQVSFAGLADFTGATIASTGATSIERLNLFGAGHDVRFNGSQVGATGLATDLTIQGDDSGVDIVTFAAQPHLDLSAFQFATWIGNHDRIVINGTVGTNLLRGAIVADTLNGDDGGDTLRGSLGADEMKGGAGNDFITYFAADELVGDVIDGGAQDVFGAGDTLLVNFTGVADFREAAIVSAGATSIESLALTGAGHTVSFDAAQVGGNGLAANLMIAGDNSGADIVTFQNASNLDLSAFQFDFWDATADLIVVIAAAAGSTITGSSMHDRFEGGDGVDVVSAGGGDDEFHSSPGADTLRGESGSDAFLYFANAQIAGDTIDGGADAGGFGDSLLVNVGLFDFTGATIASTGTTSIERLSLFGAGHDVRFNGSQVSATGVAANLTIQGDDAGADIVTFGAAVNLDLSGFTFVNWNEAIDRIVINGTGAGGALTGTTVADTIDGGGGVDVIKGGLGVDLLKGGVGNDVFLYTANDEIGAETIDGGLDSDTLRVNFTGVADFRNAIIASTGTTSIERLELIGDGNDARFVAEQFGGTGLATNLMIVGDAGVDRVTFGNAADLNLSGLQFTSWDDAVDLILVNGTAGDDTITGSSKRDYLLPEGEGAGIDTVFGGGGSDFIYGTAGADILRGEAGDDTFAYYNNANIAGDTIDGGADAGGFRDALQAVFTGLVDFTGATIASTGATSIERLTLFGAGHDVRFNASQVSAAGLAANLTIQGDDAGADIVTFQNADSLDLSGFNFSVWNEAVDRIVINGTGAGGALTGTRVADTIDGGGGVDVIKGGLGVDLLKGGAGNDVFLYTGNDEIGAETIDGGLDSDTLRVNFTGEADFRNATIASTGMTSIERLELIGNGHNVHFNASQRNTTGLAANLMIAGDNSGSDRVFFYNASSLDISQFQFTDWNPQFDNLRLFAAAAGSTITGSSMRDIFIGGAGVDVALGGAGVDQFEGSAGADVSRGGADKDVFVYRANSEIAGDTIDGGSVDELSFGDEIMVFFAGLADFTGATIQSAVTTSIEHISLHFSGHDVRFNASQVGAGGLAPNLLIQGENSGADIVTFQNAVNLDLSGFVFTVGAWNQAVDRIVINGTATDNRLTGTSVADTLNGGAGNDRLDGGFGFDLLDGGAGDGDTADYDFWAGGVTIFLAGAGDGFAIFPATSGQETLRGIENLIGGAGRDALVGDGNANVFSGGGDNDFLFAHGFNPDGTLKTGAGGDTLNGDGGNDGLFAGDGADTLNGGAGDDGLVGGAGDDTLNGGIGTDFLFGGAFSPAGARLDGSGADTLNGGDNDDGLYGFDGDDILNGDAGNDYVEGGAGADTLNGGADSDFLLGGADGDTINGGAGFDYLYGEAGGDTFVFRKGDSADWVLDFNAAQGDKLRFLDFGFTSFAAIPLIDLSSPGNPAVQLTFIEGGNVDQLTIFGVTLAQLNATNVLVT